MANRVEIIDKSHGVEELAEAGGNYSMGTNKITSLADGVDSGDAVNKGQLDDKQDILTEGEFVDGDKTKLDGIEDGADVTGDNAPQAHKTSHESGGSDEIDVSGLTGLPTRDSLGLDTDDSPQFTGIELGHASDTTLTRKEAGEMNIEGKQVLTEDNEVDVTEKRIQPRSSTTTSTATLTPALATANKTVQ